MEEETFPLKELHHHSHAADLAGSESVFLDAGIGPLRALGAARDPCAGIVELPALLSCDEAVLVEVQCPRKAVTQSVLVRSCLPSKQPDSKRRGAGQRLFFVAAGAAPAKKPKAAETTKDKPKKTRRS